MGEGMGETYEIVESDDGSNERRQVHDQQLIVRRNCEWPLGPIGAFSRLLCRVEIREEVEDVLQVVDDLVVDGEGASDDLGEVVLDLVQAR
jgi:hypothetical protein